MRQLLNQQAEKYCMAGVGENGTTVRRKDIYQLSLEAM